MADKTKKLFRITGHVINRKTREGLAGLRVEAWDKDLIFNDLVGSAVTDAAGAFLISFDESHFAELFLDRQPDLFFKVFRGETLIKSTEDSVLWNVKTEKTQINIEIEMDVAPEAEIIQPEDSVNALPPPEPWRRVYGTVRNEYGELMNGVTVQAFDRDMRNEELLGAAVTRAGQYEIRYQHSQLIRAEKATADLVLKVLEANGKELYKTPTQSIRYNVPGEVEVNLTLNGAEYQGPSEWEVLTNTLRPLMENVPPQELREDDQFQDISFLAGETGNSRLTIVIWVACFRLANKTVREQTPLLPEVFFAFLRQGQPSIFSDTLQQDMQYPERVALLEDKILRRLAAILPALQQSLLEKAIADNLIPTRVELDIKNILETLRRIKLRYAVDTPLGGGKGTLGQLIELTPAAKQEQTAFMAAFTEHTGPLHAFWKKLEDDKVLRPETLQQVKLAFEVGALTSNHIPLVGELMNMFQSGELKTKRELAKYDRSDWMRLFMRPGPDGNPIGVPANIDGDTPEAKLEQFAAKLEQQFERAYPTASFAAKLGRAEQSPLMAKTEVARFLDQNPDFQLDRFRVEHYLAEHEEALEGIRDKAALITGLKSAQRVFKLNPTYQAVDALLTRKIDSAQQIYFMGEGQFIAAMADSAINKIEARKLYFKAENAYARALVMFVDYNVAVNGATPYGVSPQTPDSEAQAKIATLPNLQMLFGSLDYCECTHCRSVYSPAAYFVDVMRFLGARGTQGSTINAGKNVQQALLERRPDLGEIELSCENTNTPLPYIDLVNEILEDVIAPPTPVTLNSAIKVDLVSGPIRPSVLNELTAEDIPISAEAQTYSLDSRGQWAIRDAQHAYKIYKTGTTLHLLPTHQTFLSAAELRANPEYTNPGAYNKLKQEVFPLNLPLDLWRLQVCAYLKHLGVPQSRLLELFQQKQADDLTLSPSDLQIDCAWLGITETERKILTGTLPGKQPWDFWGVAETGNNIPNPNTPADTTTNLTGTWIKVLSSVDVMLNRSGLEYKDLLQLLDMKFVNPTGNIFIFDTADSNAANCDTSKFTLHNLDADALNRMHRFIRLWRKLGCTMWELDLLLPDTNPAPNVTEKHITDAALQNISRMNRLREQFGLDWRIVYSLYNGIDHNLYIDRSQDGTPVVQTLYQRLFRNKLVDAVASFPPSPDQITDTIADKVPGILAAFRVKETDLNLILADLSLATTANLDATVLSHIYRITVLAQALHLNIDPFLRLKRLWAQDPFANPGATRKFVELAQQVAASDFSVLEMDYLLAHRFTPNSGVALEDKTIVIIFQAIRQGLQKISDDIRLKSEETREAYVKSKLGLLPALKKNANQVIALSIIAGTWQGTLTERNALIDVFFAGVLDLTVAKVKLTAIPGGLASEAYVQSKLGLLPTINNDGNKQAVALSIINGTWQGMPADRDTLIDSFFAGVLDLAIAKVQLAAIPEGLSLDEQQAMVAQRFDYVRPALETVEVNQRFDYIQSALETFLLQTQQEAFIHQKIAEALQLDVPSASLLLTGLQLPGDASTLLENINDSSLLDKATDGTYQLALEDANFPVIFKALRLLHKNALMISKLQIKAIELNWWLDGAHATDMGWMHPKDFPIDATSQVDIQEWIAIQQFFVWKGNLPKSDLTAFEFATRVLDNAQASAANVADLAQLTAWEVEDIKTLAAAFHWVDTGANFDVIKQKLKKSANLVRLADCMRALRRLGVNAARAVQWAKAEPNSTDADSLKQTVKAKYDLKQWQQVIQPLQDDFREQKRQALVNWLVAHPNQAQGQNWSDANGLYSYFLIDVEMSACMLTSRLKQAAASAQLFVQRCLLNLEVDILAKTDLDPKWKQWKWMKHYRVWEANRKVFLYPENWIEPELRDEKSPFFKDLENELMQNDITHETAEQAYLNYLEKLDKVANLEIRAIYDQVISPGESVLHVFGRTRSSQAPEYYYRRRINQGRWIAWEKIELDINANHLMAGIHNRRLFLLWPQFLDKADPPTIIDTPKADSSTTIAQPAKYWEIRLFWSELKKGKWTPKVLSDSFAPLDQSKTNNSPQNIEFRTRSLPFIEVRLFYSYSPDVYAPVSESSFDKIGKQINYTPNYTTAEHTNTFKEYIISPNYSRFYNNIIQHYSSWQYFYHASEETEDFAWITANANAADIRLLQRVSSGLTYSVIDSKAKAFEEAGAFFVWDPHHTYFVDYVWRTAYSGGWQPYQFSSFKFFIHYHPFVELFIKELNMNGIKGLLNRRIQVDPAGVPGSPTLFNFADYQPDYYNVAEPIPVEDVDFTYLGAYAPYNWELFFHVPFFIANKLSANQRFEEALEWYHYIFDPTNPDNTVANPDTPQQQFWITKPFYQTTKADYYKQKIENIMLSIAKGDAQLQQQVEEWRNNPFNPHLVARMRTVAYQKNVLIKYIQTLIAWGDQLFRRDTIESINEATQLYILAASVLGPRPKSIPKKVANPIKTFYQLQQEGIDDFGNVLKEVENLLPGSPSGTQSPYAPGASGTGLPASSSGTQSTDAPELPHLNVLYFCIPNNEKLLTLWDTVTDRLFKIRHCMNIEGVVRQLPLFEPPIDPALLVKAVAAGLDIGAALSDMNAPLPLYRFTFMIQRALEICSEVKSLGNAMLSALEKRDAEAFALLRSSHEQVMLNQVRLIKNSQVDEALRTKEALDESKRVIETRRDHYQKLINDGWNSWEKAWLGLTIGAITLESAGVTLDAIGASMALIPDLDAGAAGFGASPTVKLKIGGKNITISVKGAADALKGLASIAQMSAGMTSTIGSYARRAEDWDLQRQLAEKELPQIDKQIAAADIRHQIAIQDLANQDRQIENAQKEEEYMLTKFTNQELYDWMISQISTVYFQSYQLAYDLARRAERCFRYELGLSDSSYIQFGYWDSLKKGLLSGEKLYYDLKRLEAAYYEQNRREYELTKYISLAQLDPIALLKLRQNGECFVDIPETVFDMDYPGHYFRRIKTVGLSIPCTVGPYTTIACTLTLTSNHLRKDSTLLANKYVRDTANDDPRFRDEIAAIQSIATSKAQNDDGLFELNFRDERYLPFEGAGAISSWHIKINKDFPQLDASTISDIVIHLSYTAREGGELLRSKAVEEFNEKMNHLALAENRAGLFRVFDLKREYPDKWQRFLHPANPADDQAMVLDDLTDRLPYFTRSFTTKKVCHVEVVALMKDSATYNQVMLSPLGNTLSDFLTWLPASPYQGLQLASKDLPAGSEINLGPWTLKLGKLKDGTADFKSLPSDAIQELFLIINYTIA
jgi:hypothetical protein